MGREKKLSTSPVCTYSSFTQRSKDLAKAAPFVTTSYRLCQLLMKCQASSWACFAYWNWAGLSVRGQLHWPPYQITPVTSCTDLGCLWLGESLSTHTSWWAHCPPPTSGRWERSSRMGFPFHLFLWHFHFPERKDFHSLSTIRYKTHNKSTQQWFFFLEFFSLFLKKSYALNKQYSKK